MTAMAASNAVSPLATSAAAGLRNDSATQRASGTAPFSQTLQQRLDRNERRADSPQRPDDAAQRPREQAPQHEATRAAEDGKEPARGREAGAKDEAEDKTEASGERPAAAAEDHDETASPIAGLPASIAAILQNIAGQHRRPADAEGGDAATGSSAKGAAPITPFTPFAPQTGDSKADPLQNSAGQWLPAGADGDRTAADAVKQLPAKGDDNFAAQLRHTLGGEGPTTTAVTAATVGGMPQHGAPTVPRPVEMAVPTPAGHSTWADDVGSRVTLLVGRGESKAELVLTPPHLGRIEVSLSVDGDKTTAQFVAATPAARDTLEQALPRLREVLQQAGIALGQANVSTSGDQQARHEAGRRGSGSGRGPARGIGGIEAVEGGAVATKWLRRSDGMVDIFA